MNEMDAPCEVLDWDSAFFGMSIARARLDRLDVESCRTMLEWCRARGVDCLYLLAASDDDATRRLLCEAAFRAVDERVTLEQQVPEGVITSSGVRLARAGDVPALRDIAAVSHRDSRFYADDRFDRHRCDELYRTWIENSCRGWADAVMVAERDHAPAGYLTIHVRTSDSAAIGLLAVASSWQRQGVARQLVQSALRWLGDRSIATVSVVTQGRNAASLAFYRRMGFHVSTTATWYHRWWGQTP
jgi:dTDP-4-amino-4,6-dideoxy-D-galactose acyltransferase